LVLQGVLGQFFEAHFALDDLLTNARVPAAVALGHKVLQFFGFQQAMGNEQPVGEGVHAGNMGVEEIQGHEGTAAHLGAEVQTAGSQASIKQDLVDSQGGNVNLGGELVRIPTQEVITLVSIHTAQKAVDSGQPQLMLEGMPRKGCVVGFNIDFKVFL